MIFCTPFFNADAGRYRNYNSCSWRTAGIGRFRRRDSADPFIGAVGSVERFAELLRVETICEDRAVRAMVAALLEAHPYAEPAYELIRSCTAADPPTDQTDSADTGPRG